MIKIVLFLYFVFFSSYSHAAVDIDPDSSEQIMSFDDPVNRGSGHWTKNDKVILDCDGTFSDITALLFLLKAEEKKLGPQVIAVTTVRGIISAKQAAINVIRALALAGRTDIPCYIGADEPIAETPCIPEVVATIGGIDGLGDVPYDPTLLPSPQDKPAALALIKLVKELKGKVVIITAGALTNIALAMRLEKHFLKNVKKIFIGAGSFSGIGDIHPGIEFKAWMDPDALKIVWNSTFYENTYVIPLGPIYQINADIPLKFWNKVNALPDPFIQFVEEISQVYINNGAPGGNTFHDPITVAAYLWPQIVEDYEPHIVTVSTECDCRGATFGGVTDFATVRDDLENSNANVARSISAQGYMKMILKLFGNKKN